MVATRSGLCLFPACLTIETYTDPSTLLFVGNPDFIADRSGVRPSTSRSGDQIPGFGGRVDGADASEAYRSAPRAEEGDLGNSMRPSS